ncbi:centrosomal protein of 112 kDa-like [Leptidea sinapis]|uniref:centrosomal protein of 112 kDa-like n=1 Tax=Leptidea sinapis TaxID=189913 RepID=UPI002137EF29|nr:centrosomal protein of 112 kDa-like [Leptidea sinapis]
MNSDKQNFKAFSKIGENMNENDGTNLDTEFKRYLQIMRNYLGQLIDQDVIEICNAWIQKLSNCKDDEKYLRNKYTFSLCYQLAIGVLDHPFLTAPNSESLDPLDNETQSDELSSEVECIVIDSEHDDIKTECDVTSTPRIVSSTPRDSIPGSEYDACKSNKQSSLCCTYGVNPADAFVHSDDNFEYQHRAVNLIMKLREIKNQNLILHNELIALKKESKIRNEEYQDSCIVKVNTSTSTNSMEKNSVTNLECLKNKLQEVHDSRNSLLDSLEKLQNQIDSYNMLKKHEIDDIEAKHKLEMIGIKTTLREEITADFEIQLQDLKQKHDQALKQLHIDKINEIEQMNKFHDDIITEKNIIIQKKDAVISDLKNQLDEIKSNQLCVINKLLDKPERAYDNSHVSSKIEELERKIIKIEREKLKLIKIYEAKIANLQRQKHLAECSVQLQALKQRSQAINEVDENQAELHTAIDKLENKYKEIVANVQATAVQRRMQDQIALDAIIQAICGSRNESPYINSRSPNSCKTMHNSNKDSNGCDAELSTLFSGNKVGSVIVGNKIYADDSAVNDYCLGRDKVCELFERIHIPQRDTENAPSKK